MKTIRSLICACVLLAASACYAFSVGQQVIVIDVNSPYHLQIGVVTKVRHRNKPNEIDTVLIRGPVAGPIAVKFAAWEIKVFPAVNPPK